MRLLRSEKFSFSSEFNTEGIDKLRELTDKLPEITSFVSRHSGQMFICPSRGELATWCLYECDELSIIRFQCVKGTELFPHVHKEKLFLIVYCGEIEHKLGDESWKVLRRKDAVSCPEGVPHAFRALTDSMMIAVSIPPFARGAL